MTDLATGSGFGRARDVPLTLRLRLIFGGSFSQFGWVFFGFGLALSLVFLLHSEVATFWKFTGPLQRTAGMITNVKKTGAEENDVPVYAIHYTYQSAGATLTGTSYVTGNPPEPHSAATVEYQPAHPQWSRLQGMRSAEFDWVVVFTLIFPLVGLGILLAGLLKGRRTIRLLRSGLPATGTLTAITYTNVEINHQPQFRLTFAFTTANGETITTQYTTCDIRPEWQHLIPGQGTQPDQAPATTQAQLLYLPAHPRTVCLIEEFGDSVAVDGDGVVQDRKPWTGLAAAILPLLSIAVNTGILLRVMLQK